MLFVAGVPAAITPDGKSVPQFMLYDADTLRGLGYKGCTMEAAAKDAMANRKPGKRVYQFQRTDDQAEIVDGYRKAQMQLASGQSLDLEHVTKRELGAIATAFTQMRRKILSDFSCTALLVQGKTTEDKGRPMDKGGRVVKSEFRAVGVNASQSLKDEVRL